MASPPQIKLSEFTAPRDPDDLLSVLEEVAAHGPIVAFRYGGQERVLINDAHLAHQLLADGTDEMRRTPITDSVRALIGDNLVTSTAPQWRPRRLLIQRELSRSRMLAESDTVMATVQRRIDGWCTGEVFDLQEEMASLTLDNLGDVVFGADFGSHRALIRRAMPLLQTINKSVRATFTP